MQNSDAIMTEACEHHEGMIACIEQRDAEGMVELIKQHWALSHRHMEMFVRPDPLPIE